MDTETTSEHKLQLASELLDDIELNRLPTEKLLLKARRLARLVGNQEVESWLHYEMAGFSNEDEISKKYMDYTGRWTDKAIGQGWWWGLAQIEAQIAACQEELRQLRIPDINVSLSSSNPYESVRGVMDPVWQTTQTISGLQSRMRGLNSTVTTLSGVKNRVLNLLHMFISNVFYELKFSGMQGTIFEKHRSAIDHQLAERCGEVLKKVPSVYDRLTAREPEAVSQALTTCRRIIDAFADSLFPAQESKFTIDGTELEVKADNHKNRINAFVYQHCESASRRARLKKRLDSLYERVATGIHNDVSADEARCLFLDTYLLLGEILGLSAKNGGTEAG